MQPATPTIRSLAVPILPLGVLFGHAEGFSWDEALMVLAPIAIIAGVLLYANHKVQGRFGPSEDRDPAADLAGPRADAAPGDPGGPADPA